MKGLPWSIVVLACALLASMTFLIYEGKLDSEVFLSLISALTGGGLLHVGGVAVRKSKSSDDNNGGEPGG